MNIAEKLIMLRKEKKLTQENVADIFKISLTAIRNYENISNPRIPKNEILVEMSKYYNVDILYLLDDNNVNRTHEKIQIGKLLSLDDPSIGIIKHFKDNNVIDSFNYLLNDELFTLIIYEYNFLLQLEVYRRELFSFVDFYFNFNEDIKKIIIFENKNNVWDISSIINFLKKYEEKVRNVNNFLKYASLINSNNVPCFFNVITENGRYQEKMDSTYSLCQEIYSMLVENPDYKLICEKLYTLDELHEKIFEEIYTLHTITKNSILEYMNDICKFNNLTIYDQNLSKLKHKTLNMYSDKEIQNNLK